MERRMLALLSHAVHEAASVSRVATDFCISALFIFLHSLQGKPEEDKETPASCGITDTDVIIFS